MKKWKWLLSVGAAAVALSACAVVFAQPGEKTSEKISDRIYIGEVNVGGMTAEEASLAVVEYVEGLKDEKVTLKAGDNTVTATVEELGLVWSDETVAEDAVNLGKTGNLIARYKVNKDLEHEDKVLPVTLEADDEKTKAFLKEHRKDLDQEPKDYGLIRKDGAFEVVDGEDGVVLNMDKSIEAIDVFFAEGWKKDAVHFIAGRQTMKMKSCI